MSPEEEHRRLFPVRSSRTGIMRDRALITYRYLGAICRNAGSESIDRCSDRNPLHPRASSAIPMRLTVAELRPSNCQVAEISNLEARIGEDFHETIFPKRFVRACVSRTAIKRTRYACDARARARAHLSARGYRRIAVIQLPVGRARIVSFIPRLSSR